MDNNKCSCSRLSVCNLGVAIGFVHGLFMVVLAIALMYSEAGRHLMDTVKPLYIGYEASFLGALIGFVWGFIVGYVYGALIAFVYNFCYCRCPCKYCKTNNCKDGTCK